MKRIKGIVKNDVVVLEEGVRLPEGIEVEVRVPTRRQLRHAAIQRILENPITHPVGMDEIIEEDKRERDNHWWPENDSQT